LVTLGYSEVVISLRNLRYRIRRPGLSQGLLRAHRTPKVRDTVGGPTGIPRTKRHTAVHLLCVLKAREQSASSVDACELGCWSLYRVSALGMIELLKSGRSIARSCPTRVQYQASRPPVRSLDYFAVPQLVYLLPPLPSANDGVRHEPQPHVIYQTSMNIHIVTIRTIVVVCPIEFDDRVLSDLHGMAAAMRALSPLPPIMAGSRVRELSP
jgi:hypothetical protein